MKQKSMSRFAFRFMSCVMHIKKLFRDLNKEIGLVGIKKNNTILDYGCGLGFNTIPAALSVGEGGKVYALDVSPLAVKTVERKMLKHNLQNVNTILDDKPSGIANNSIDIVYLHNTLPLIKNKHEALDEVNRVLKHSGRLSYVSRAGSRVFGEDNMSNKQVETYLVSTHQFRLIIEKKGHCIYEK